MSIDNLLWCEKHRPRVIEDCILPERLSDFFGGMVKKGEIQNMTLVGGAGKGKTTVARALCEQMGWDYIIINASEERNIETIRTTVRQYGSTVSVFSESRPSRARGLKHAIGYCYRDADGRALHGRVD